MVHFTAATGLAFFSLLLRSTVATDDLSHSIVGCNDVSCPKVNDYDRCTINDHTFLGVGLTRIADVPSSLEGISLVKGVNVSAPLAEDKDKPTRPFTSVYYLGTPSDVKTKDLSGCAVIFNDPPSNKFDRPKMEAGPKVEGHSENVTDTRAAYGTCPDVVDKKCIEALTKRANKVADDTDSNPCSALERELKKDDLDDCKNLGGAGNGFGNFTVTSFGDLKSVKNESADCWPITPKSDGLAEIAVEISHVCLLLRFFCYNSNYITGQLQCRSDHRSSLQNHPRPDRLRIRQGQRGRQDLVPADLPEGRDKGKRQRGREWRIQLCVRAGSRRRHARCRDGCCAGGCARGAIDIGPVRVILL